MKLPISERVNTVVESAREFMKAAGASTVFYSIKPAYMEGELWVCFGLFGDNGTGAFCRLAGVDIITAKHLEFHLTGQMESFGYRAAPEGF